MPYKVPHNRYAPDRRVTWMGKVTYKRKPHPFTLHRCLKILIPLFNTNADIEVDGKYKFDTRAEVWGLYGLASMWMDNKNLFQYRIVPGLKELKDRQAPNGLPSELEAFYKWFDKAVEGLQIGINVLKLIAPELTPYIELLTQINNLYRWSRSL